MLPYIPLTIFVLLGSVSKLYKKFINLSIGFELKTFFAIVITYKLGFFVGFACSAIMVFLSALIAGRLRHVHWVFIKIAGYAAVCASTLFFIPISFLTAGLISAMILNLVYLLANMLLGDQRYQDIIGNALNILITYLLLAGLGKWVMGFL